MAGPSPVEEVSGVVMDVLPFIIIVAADQLEDPGLHAVFSPMADQF
jgi:hypothetical protein